MNILDRGWTPQIITAFWRFYEAMWEARNNNLHDGSTLGTSIKNSNLSATVTRLYSLQDTFSQSDHVLFDLPLSQRLGTSKKSQKHWVRLVLRYKTNTGERKWGPQRLLTTYFTRSHRNSTDQSPQLDPLLEEDPPKIQDS